MVSEQNVLEPETRVDGHGDFLYRYALSRVRDSGAAEDLVQETFLAALKSRENFTGQSSERTWLVGILKHKIIDYFRKVSRERPSSDMEAGEDFTERFFDKKGMWKSDTAPSEWQMDPAAVMEQKELAKTLEDCMAKLPARLSHAFQLVEMDEIKTDEVCKVLNITATNLWVMLYRARMSLKRCLETNWFHKSSEKEK